MKKLICILWLTIISFSATAQIFSPVGMGFAGGNSNIKALAVDNTGGLLYATGVFTHLGNGLQVNKVARWNGNMWDSISGGWSNGAVGFSAAFHNGLVYFGGSFQSFGGIPDTGLAVFDGTNVLLSSNFVMSGSVGAVRGIVSQGQELYVVGYRGLQDGIPFNQVAKWDGAVWTHYPMLDTLNGWPVGTAAV